jgi:hypothetical protein
MRRTTVSVFAVLAALLAGAGPSRAEEAKAPADGAKAEAPAAPAAPEDPALVGEEVEEPSEIERALRVEHRKRRTAHFALETSLDMDACKELISFCERSYREFLAWASLPPEKELWPVRAQVAVIDRKEEWERLIVHCHRGEPEHVVNEHLFAGADWSPSPPLIILYSHEGSDRRSEEFELFHFLNHLFLHGLAGSGKEGIVWWLWEGFSAHREAEVFGQIGHRCALFETGPDLEGESVWFDRDDWVFFLKRDVRAGKDEPLQQFWKKDYRRIPQWNRAKAWSLVRYLVRDEAEKAKFVRFVSMLETSANQERALLECYGLSPDGLDAAWREWALKQPNWWKKKRR